MSTGTPAEDKAVISLPGGPDILQGWVLYRPSRWGWGGILGRPDSGFMCCPIRKEIGGDLG